MQIVPGLGNPIVVAPPCRVCCRCNPIANAVGGHLHGRMIGHVLHALVDLAQPLSHRGQRGAVVGNDNVRTLGGKVLNRPAHEGQFAFKASESLGGGIACGLRGGRIGFLLKVQLQVHVFGVGVVHFISPTAPCRLTGSAPSRWKRQGRGPDRDRVLV